MSTDARRRLLQDLGGFNTAYRFHSDFDLKVRLFMARRISSIHVAEALVRMRAGGQSNRSLRNVFRGSRKSCEIARCFGVASSPLWVARKLGLRMGQFFRRSG